MRLGKHQIKKKHIIVWFIILCTIWIGIVNHNERDYYEKNIAATDLLVAQNVPGGETGLESGYHSKIFIDSVSGYKGAFVESKTFPMEEGKYRLSVSYDVDVAGSSVSLYAPNSATKENQRGVLLATLTLPEGQNEASIEFELTNRFQEVMLKSDYNGGKLILKNINLISNGTFYADSIFSAICIVLFMLIGLYAFPRWKKEKQVAVVVVLALTFISTLPFFNDFLIKGQDMEFHLARIDGICQAIKQGHFPVRINPVQSFGYGYATSILYPEAFLYLPALLRMMGVSLMLSYKVFIVVMNFGTAIIGYVSFKGLLKNSKAAYVATILYTLGSYRLINIFQRAAIGESLAMIFLPLLIWGMYELFYGDKRKWYISVFAFSGLVQSHIITTQIVLLVTIIAFLIAIPKLYKEVSRIGYLIIAAVVTVIANLWTVLPMLSYMKLPLAVMDATNDLHKTSLYLSQMFTLSVGQDTIGCLDLGTTKGEMAITIGLSLIIGVALFIWLSNSRYTTNRAEEVRIKKIGWHSFGYGIFAFFATTWLFPWEAIQSVEWLDKVVNVMQFPYRLLVLSSVFFSITAACGVCLLIMNFGYKDSVNEAIGIRKYIGEIAVACIAVFALVGCFLQIDIASQSETYQSKNELLGVHNTDVLYLYEGTDLELWRQNGTLLIPSDDSQVVIRNYDKINTDCSFDLEVLSSTEHSYLELPLAYYPGYKAILNGDKEQEVVLTKGNNGVVRIDLPSEGGEIKVFYEPNKLWLAGNIASLLTWFTIIVYIVYKKKKVV